MAKKKRSSETPNPSASDTSLEKPKKKKTVKISKKKKEESAKKLIEPFTKDQLIDIISRIASKDSETLQKINEIADKSEFHRKVFVHSLSWETKSEDLRSALSKYGEIEECSVILDPASGKCKGYGFVVFKTKSQAQAAIKDPVKALGDRKFYCDLASSNPKRISSSSIRRIYVSQVPPDMPSEKLLNFFSKYGEIEDHHLGVDKESGKRLGFALIVFKTFDNAKKAIEEPMKIIDGHALHCKFSNSQENSRKNQNNAISGPVASSSATPANFTLNPSNLMGNLPYQNVVVPGLNQTLNPVMMAQAQGQNPSLNHNLPIGINPALVSNQMPLSQPSLYIAQTQNPGSYSAQNPGFYLAQTQNPCSYMAQNPGSYSAPPANPGSYHMQHTSSSYSVQDPSAYPAQPGYSAEYGSQFQQRAPGKLNQTDFSAYASQASNVQSLNAYRGSQSGQSSVSSFPHAGAGVSLGGMNPYMPY